MRIVICFVMLLLSWYSFADSIYDTIYHPFYNGVQLIELRNHSDNQSQKGFLQIDQSAGNNQHIPKFILRDTNGQIINKYNDFDNSINEKNLKETKPTNKFEQAHHLSVKNTSHYVGNDDSGYNIVYPIYSCSAISDSLCLHMKVGLLDTLGKIVLPMEFEQIQWIDSVFITQDKGLFSLFSHEFKLLLSDYQLIDYINPNKNHILLKKNNTYGLINRDGKYLISMEFEELRESKYMHGHYEFLKKGLWGFADYSFSKVYEPFSPSTSIFQRDGYFQYCDDKKLWIVIDSKGKIILKSPLEMYQVLSPSRFLVTKYDREEGYQRSISDAYGNILTDIIYYDIWRINNATLIAGNDASIHDASNLKKSTKWILLDVNGKQKNNQVYKSLSPLDDTWIKAWDKNGKHTVIDGNGTNPLGYEIEDIYKYSEHLYKIKSNGKHQFLDLAFPSYISKSYDNLICVRENKIGVENDGKWGFVHGSTLKEITPIMYDHVTCFKNGIASIEYNKKWTLIDSLGQPLTSEQYSTTTVLEGGYTQVCQQGKFGVVNRNGDYTVPMVYDEMKFIISQNNTFFIGVKKNGKYGIVNIRNEIVYPFVFETCGEISVHANIPQNRQEGFYAFLTITKRSTIEYYYLNFDQAKNEVKIQANPTKGFKTFTHKCSSNPSAKCVGVVNWDGNQVIPADFSYIKDLKYNTFEVHTVKGCGLMDTLGRTLIPPIYGYMYELGHDSTILQVGRHSGTWGLYTRTGKMIADTIYGGFEEPINGLIPFYENFNFRIQDNQWVHDDKKIGFMDLNGKIILEPLYDQIYRDYPQKGQIRLNYGINFCVIDEKGKLLEGKFNTESHQNKNSIQPPTKNKKNKKRKPRMKWL